MRQCNCKLMPFSSLFAVYTNCTTYTLVKAMSTIHARHFVKKSIMILSYGYEPLTTPEDVGGLSLWCKVKVKRKYKASPDGRWWHRQCYGSELSYSIGRCFYMLVFLEGSLNRKPGYSLSSLSEMLCASDSWASLATLSIKSRSFSRAE